GSIKLEKTANIQIFLLPGTVINYNYAIINTGNLILNQVSLTDSKIGTISCPQTTLNPSQEMICTASYTTTLDDVRNGAVTNTATVTSMTVNQVLVSSTTSLTVGFDPDLIRKKTLEAINLFLKARAQIVLSNQPDRRRIMNRLSPRLYNCSGAPNAAISPSITGSMNLNASISTNELCMEMNDFDFWSEVHAGYYYNWQNDRFTRNQGAFNVSYFGADYLVNNAIVAGLLVEVDLVGQAGDSLGFNRAYGNGWLVGPYLSARVASDVYLHTRAAWGQSNNTINVFGLYQDHFNTNRSLYNAELVGDWYYSSWRFSPTVGFTYYNEEQHNFMNAVNVNIPGQDIAVGQFNIGPELSYIYLNDSLKQFITRLSFQGIYNFDTNRKQDLRDNNFFDGFSGRVKLGTEIRFPSGLTLIPMIQYDGIGINGLSSIQGQIQINIPLDSSPISRRIPKIRRDDVDYQKTT
ncbi:TPA: autotransporter outer membrane beta-barrel domain-containing protein, partial [Legionella pneumophila]